MDANSPHGWEDTTPLFDPDPIFAAPEQQGQAVNCESGAGDGATPLLERTTHGHLQLRADSPAALRESIGPTLDMLANRKALQNQLRHLGVDYHRLPGSILITGGRGSGKRHTVQRYLEALLAVQTDMPKTVTEIHGADIAPDFLQGQFRRVLCVTDLGALADNRYVHHVLATIASVKEHATIAFVGTPAEAQRLFSQAPEFSRVLALEIPLPDFTAEELFTVFEQQFTSRGQHLTAKARTRAHRYFTSLEVPTSLGAPSAHEAMNFADQVAAAQYRRLHGRPENNLKVEVREIRGSDIEECLPPTSPTGQPSAQEQLDRMVGLQGVKDQLAGITAQAALNTRRRQAGLPPVNSSLHMAFLGAPGTGKTQVARVVAKLLHEAGVVSRGQLVERSRHNLVGQHIGSTARLVQEALEEARGGVLFIDEAYALAPTSDRDFGHEAIATLIQGMENYRDDLMVILAGYGPEMEALFQTNPGFSSRVGTRIEFPDYSELELLDIFRTFACTHHMRLGPGVAEQVLALAGHAVSQPGFGNARWVRNLFESAVLRQAVRLGSSAGDLSELLIDDLTAADPH